MDDQMTDAQPPPAAPLGRNDELKQIAENAKYGPIEDTILDTVRTADVRILISLYKDKLINISQQISKDPTAQEDYYRNVYNELNKLKEKYTELTRQMKAQEPRKAKSNGFTCFGDKCYRKRGGGARRKKTRRKATRRKTTRRKATRRKKHYKTKAQRRKKHKTRRNARRNYTMLKR
jgi:hypothetical protein